MKFKVVIIPGVKPSDIPEGIVMYAPRPLFGEEVILSPSWGWAGQVVVDPSDKAKIENNYRMDAKVVIWILPNVMIQKERERLSNEYGAEALQSIEDDDILQMAIQTNRDMEVEL